MLHFAAKQRLAHSLDLKHTLKNIGASPPQFEPTNTPHRRTLVQDSTDHLKRLVLMIILALAWVGSASGWVAMEGLGRSSTVLRVVFGLNLVFHPIMWVITWRRLLPMRVVEVSCLLFAAGICAACLALGLYSPHYGASIDIQPLYLWIPTIYVFAFTLSGHRSGLTISLMILTLFVLITLPYLVWHFDQPYGNFTVQLHVVSAVLIAAMYFFSSYQRQLQIAQLTVDELARLANTDELTKLANRRRMVEVIESELIRFARYGHAFSIVLIDIDHFKRINDRYGHQTGDLALVSVAGRIVEMQRDVDTLGRWGGEEFLMVLPETAFEQSLNKAALLCNRVSATPVLGSHAITVSCGVTSVIAGDSANTLLGRADVALYAAKRGGRNRVEGQAQHTAH